MSRKRWEIKKLGNTGNLPLEKKKNGSSTVKKKKRKKKKRVKV